MRRVPAESLVMRVKLPIAAGFIASFLTVWFGMARDSDAEVAQLRPQAKQMAAVAVAPFNQAQIWTESR